jgi:hypothetical protein
MPVTDSRYAAIARNPSDTTADKEAALIEAEEVLRDAESTRESRREAERLGAVPWSLIHKDGTN